MSERFWRLLPAVRRHERQRFLFFGSLSLLVSAAQNLGLVGAESLFLARLGAERLPETFIAASLIAVAGSFAYAMVVGRARNDSLFFWMLCGAVLLVGAGAGAVRVGWPLALPGLLCLWYLLQAVFLSHFMTFAVDYFDPAASRRLFPLFTIAASVGGALGGLLGMLIARGPGPLHLVTGWALLFALAAAILRLGRRGLRRSGPLDLEEADETSLEGMRGALRYLRSSALGRALALSALGMVMAFFVAQYLYSDLFARAFPDPAELATFFGLYQAITNLIEIGIGFTVTPWLIRGLGVASANVLHPLLTLVAFGALALHQGLGTALAARANRELVDNATGYPIRSLVYNAMPLRLRGRMRAFLEGIVVYAGMSAAGGLLLAIGRPDPLWLCAAGATAALIFLGATLAARRAYLGSLVDQLRAGSLDLADIAGEIGGWEATRLAELWEQMLGRESGRPSRTLLEIVPHLAERGIAGPLLREAGHPHPEVRRACLVALARLPGAEVDAALARALDDPDARVRLAALRAASARPEATPDLRARMRERLADPSPEVRALAACHAGERGLAILEEMIAGRDAATRCAALAAAPPRLLGRVQARAFDADPAVRAAALEALARGAAEPPLSEAQVLEAARHPDPGVRRAALLLLAHFDTEGLAMTALAAALVDPAAEVSRTAETLLGSLGEEGVRAALPHLQSDSERAAEGALRVLAACGAWDRIAAHLRERARDVWYHLIAFQLLPEGEGPAGRFLRLAVQDAMLGSRRLAFRALEQLEDGPVIRKVERALAHGSTRRRGDALEVLSNLGDRVSGQLLALLHESGSLADRRRGIEHLIAAPASREGVVEAALGSGHRFVRMGARALTGAGPAIPKEEEEMERLLALKQVPLFSQLSLEQLEAVLRFAIEKHYLEGEVVCREGDPGGVLYLLMEGRVRIYKGYQTPAEQMLHVQTEGSYFGEMAILDDEPRSATAVAGTAARLLCLEGSDLKELILQMPNLSFEILRVLTARVRAAEARLASDRSARRS